MKADDIEAEVWTAVERVLRNPELIETEVARQHGSAEEQLKDIATQRHTLEAALERYDRQEKRWHDAYAGEVIDLAEYRVRRAEIDAVKHTLQAELYELDIQEESIDLARTQIESLRDYCRRVRDQLSTFSHDEKVLALAALDIQVTFVPGEDIGITGVIPLDIIAFTTGQHV